VNVIVVIGGDDYYKNEAEEEQSVISRWAKRKIAYSQFSEEFMDGRKSFVFSWNKNHRVIHEEALLHYFDPSKKGQKFEYQPPQGPSSQTPRSASSTKLEIEDVEEGSAQQLSSMVSRVEISNEMGNRAGARPKEFNASRSPKGQSQIDPLQRNPLDREPGHGLNTKTKKQPATQATTAMKSRDPPARSITGEPVLLRSLLFNGIISYQLADLQLWDPTFTVPDHINQDLFQRYHDTPVTGVTIVQGIDGTLRWSVDPKLIEVSRSRYEGIRIADNETFMLKTRILYGQVSFQESDVHFRYGNWQIPQYIVESLKEEYCLTPCGELYIISDDRENLRQVVKVGTISRVRSAVSTLSAVNKQGF